MKRLAVEFRPEALADLVEIFNFVFELSRRLEVSRRFTLRIRNRCERIGDLPSGGRARSDLRAGLRTVAFERSAVIAYSVSGDRVQIINIFYGGRDFEALYRGSQETGKEE